MQTELKSSKGEAAALGPIPAPEETGPESTPVMSRQSKAGGQAGGHVEARVSKGENIASEKLHIPLARSKRLEGAPRDPWGLAGWLWSEVQDGGNCIVNESQDS